jgi:hypothetical protein
MTMMHANDPQWLLAGGSGEWTPDHLARLMATVSQSGLSCGDVARSIIGRFDADASALHAAMVAVADHADRSGTANAFHNPQHSRDVGVIWINLALANNRLARSGQAPQRLSDRELMLGICAAFGHDMGHDGTSNNVTTTGPDGIARSQRIAFRLETVAADCVCDILHAHGAEAADMATTRAAILATDVVDGYAALETALGGFESGQAPKPDGDFAALADPAVTLIAAILRDADVMPSAGLSAGEYDRNTALLERELGFPRHHLGPAGAEEFFGSALGGRFLSPPGKLFQTRLNALRALNRIRLQRPGPVVGLAAIDG